MIFKIDEGVLVLHGYD